MPEPGALFAALLFGVIGLAMLRVGRRSGNWKTMGCALALIVFPYAVETTWLLYLIGGSLCILLWIWRD